MIFIITDKPSSEQIQEMLKEHETMIKIVVNIRRKILAGGGKMHADCESILLNNGSEQDDLWGANWYVEEQDIEFESLINIRPTLGNRSIIIQSQELREKVESVTRQIFGGVQ